MTPDELLLKLADPYGWLLQGGGQDEFGGAG
jgi:hypothetical protein